MTTSPIPARAESASALEHFRSASYDEERLNREVTTLISRYLQESRITSGASLDELAASFAATAIPEQPLSPRTYLDTLERSVLDHAINTASPYFIGHMTTALPYLLRPLSQLVTALNQNPVKVETSKVFTVIERQSLAMLHRLIFDRGDRGDEFYARHTHQRGSSLGIVTSGGTSANISALWVARNRALPPDGDFAGVEADGLAAALVHYGYKRAVVLGSRLLHYSFEKAAGVLGIGERGLVRVAVDERGAMKPAALRCALDECKSRGELVIAVVGIAGTTESGGIDPLAELADIAHEAGVHFHVDAAWSGPLLLSRRHRHKLAGIEKADSVTIDGHKQLYLPMGIGAVAFREPDAAAAIEKYARYIIRRDSADLGRRSLEGSRPAMSLLLHAALHVLGARGYEELIDSGVARAQYLAHAVARRPELELLGEPESNLVNYRYIPPELRLKARLGKLTAAEQEEINGLNQRLQEEQWRRGKSFISRTTLTHTRHGDGVAVVVLRAVLANPLTQEEHIDAVLHEQLEIAASLVRESDHGR